MALVFYAAKTRSGERQAQLPLTIEGELGTTISTFSSATFTLDTNAKDCPADYNTLLEPHLMSIVAVERDDVNGYSKPIWMGLINDTPSNSDGKLSITCASLEWYLTTRRAKDCRFEPTADIMDIPAALVAQVEAGGVGIGLLTDCPASGTKRALVLRESDGQSVVDVLAALDMEWTIALDWADSSQAVVTKTFTARYPRLGYIEDHPEFMVASPGNVFHWDYTAPMTEGKTATYVVAVGDGTGDLRTTSLPKVDTAREAAGYPRVEIYKSFQGVTNVNDADTLADQVSKEVFTRTHAVTTTVRNEGATRFRNLALGSSVRVIIADRGIDEVWRFVGWLMDSQGQFWKPTLGRLAEKVKAFPRPPMPNDPGRALVDMSGRVSLAGYQDPLANGYKFPAGPDGKAFTIDPIAGFGHTDAMGGFAGFGAGMDVTGTTAKVADWRTTDRKMKIQFKKDNGYDDAVTECKFMYSYSPRMGDIVALSRFDGEWIALGALEPSQATMFGHEFRSLALANPATYLSSWRASSDDPAVFPNAIYGINFGTPRANDSGGTPVENRGAPAPTGYNGPDGLTPGFVSGYTSTSNNVPTGPPVAAASFEFLLPGTYRVDANITVTGSTWPQRWDTTADGYFLNEYVYVVADGGTGDAPYIVASSSAPGPGIGGAPAVIPVSFIFDASAATEQAPKGFCMRFTGIRSGGTNMYDSSGKPLGPDEYIVDPDSSKTWLTISRLS